MKNRLDDPESYSNINPYASHSQDNMLLRPKPRKSDAWEHTDLFEIGNGDGGTLGRLLADIASSPATNRLEQIERLSA